ncbi:MAG TPA: LPS export ABC transporter permease LptG [Candidatus Duodenibacillus intestinigallinarum]|nr:LPS export ABC transporter permease LptG [Candidatus Duodenibacillus intestinigallinarum]
MKVLTRHVAKEVLIATLFVLVALVALIAFFDLVSQARNIGNRYSISMALFLTMLKLPSRLYEVMPIAALLGAVYTMSRLASNSEFTIMRVAGLSPFRLAGMMTVPALILIAMTYCLGEWLTPAADMMRNDMDNILFNRKLSARGYSSGVWVKDNVKEQQNAGQATVRFVNVHNLIAGEHSRTGAWRVFEFDKDGSLIRVLHAPEASYISGRGWHLKDAKVETLPKITHDETPMVEKSSARKDVDLMLPSEMRPEILGVLTIKPERMGISDLWQYIAHLKETKQTSDRYQVALWSKVFYPLAIFVMLAVAMPFAYLNTRSGGVSIKIFAGLMIGISFYALNNIFSFLGVLNTWHPMVVAVVPTSVMLICAAVALWLLERR